MPIDFNALGDNVNTGNLGGNPFLVEQLYSSLRKCRNFGKAWDVGDQMTAYYPFKWYVNPNDPSQGIFAIHSSAFYGHKVGDMKVLGTTFLRSNAVISPMGQVVGDGDLAYQFSRISSLLINAQREKELADLASRDWSIMGQSAYDAARKQVMDAYDPQTNMNAKRPLLGALTIQVQTEVVVVSMDPNNGNPIFDDNRKQKTGNYIQDLSAARKNKLAMLANDPQHGILAQNPGLVPKEDTVYFLEVLYNFTSAKGSKSEAGRADPQGVAASLTLSYRFPDKVSKIKELQDRVPATAQGIAAHTYQMDPMSDEVLREKLKRVMFDSAACLHLLSMEDQERLLKNAKLLDYLRVAPTDDALNQKFTEKLGHAIGQAPVAAPKSIVDEDGNPDYEQQGCPFTMDELLEGTANIEL